MKTKASLILILTLTMLAGAACAPATPSAPAPSATPVIPTATAAPTLPASACPEPTAETKLLTNTDDGYCLLYPAEHVADLPGAVVINPVSGAGDIPGDAWFQISAEDAAGRTLEQLRQEFTEISGTGFNVTVQDVQVDNGPALVVDGLPGFDANRMVYIFRNERLYILGFLPWFPDEAPVTPLEHLYETVMQSLHFLPPAKALPTPTREWGQGNVPPALTFEYPLDGQTLAYEGDYLFKVRQIPDAEAYFWSFSQNGVVVWQNLADDQGLTAGGEYLIARGSKAHSQFVPGPVEVTVRAVKGNYFADPTVITVILE